MAFPTALYFNDSNNQTWALTGIPPAFLGDQPQLQTAAVSSQTPNSVVLNSFPDNTTTWQLGVDTDGNLTATQVAYQVMNTLFFTTIAPNSDWVFNIGFDQFGDITLLTIQGGYPDWLRALPDSMLFDVAAGVIFDMNVRGSALSLLLGRRQYIPLRTVPINGYLKLRPQALIQLLPAASIAPPVISPQIPDLGMTFI